MSSQNVRSDETRIDASHLSHAAQKTEDWEDMEPRSRARDEDLEAELENDEPDAETPAKPRLDPAEAIDRLQKLQESIPEIIVVLQEQLEEVEKERADANAKFDRKAAEIQNRLNFALQISGKPEKVEKRGRPRKDAAEKEGARERTAGGKRFKNEYSLKQTVAVVMSKMDDHTGTVSEITKAVLASGYQSSIASKFTYTVRNALNQLVDKGLAKKNDEQSYTLHKKAIDLLKKYDGEPEGF